MDLVLRMHVRFLPVIHCRNTKQSTTQAAKGVVFFSRRKVTPYIRYCQSGIHKPLINNIYMKGILIDQSKRPFEYVETENPLKHVGIAGRMLPNHC